MRLLECLVGTGSHVAPKPRSLRLSQAGDSSHNDVVPAFGIRARGLKCASKIAGLAAVIVACTACQELHHRTVGVTGISALELQQMLEKDASILLLDVRDAELFLIGHIPNAVSVQLDEIDGYLARAPLRRNISVVTVCRKGVASVTAAAVVSGHGFSFVRSLNGGMEDWFAMGGAIESGAGPRLGEEELRPPVQDISRAAEFVMVINGFVIKPIHMILSIPIILILWRQRARDLVFIRWGLIAFLFGEIMCASNYLFANDESFVLELLHDLGMVGLAALLSWGFFYMVDDRVLRITAEDKPCAIQRLCRACWKRDDSTCGLQRIFLLSCGALVVIATLPLMAPLRPYNVIWEVFGQELSCPLHMNLMILEFRVFPVIAITLLIVASVRLLGGRDSLQKAVLPFFLGFGFLAFSLLRFTLFEGFRAVPCWAFLWEEITELLTVVGVGAVLWIFRRQLGLTFPFKRDASPAEEDPGVLGENG